MASSSNRRIGPYILGKGLGVGTFGKVKHATHSVTKKEVAIKIIDKQQIRQNNMANQIKREVAIMKNVLSNPTTDEDSSSIRNNKSKGNKHIVQLYEVLASKSKIYLILELIKGGELFDEIVRETRFTESKARKYFLQLIEGVEFCHNVGVCHRDLKPENLLLDSNGNLKISDFGLSALCHNEDNECKDDDSVTNENNRCHIGDSCVASEHLRPTGDRNDQRNTIELQCSQNIFMSSRRANLLHTTCGTPNYVAPEVLEDKGYDGRSADVWSMGVILYVLVSGCLPFDEPTLPHLFAKIKNADFTFVCNLSEELKDLICKILISCPKRRASIVLIKSHPWCIDGEDKHHKSRERRTENLLTSHHTGKKDNLSLSHHMNDSTMNSSQTSVRNTKHNFQFTSWESINGLHKIIKYHLNDMGFSLDESCTYQNKIKAHIKSSRGMIGLKVSIFEDNEGAKSRGGGSVRVVEIQRGRGDILHYTEWLDILINTRLRSVIETIEHGE